MLQRDQSHLLVSEDVAEGRVCGLRDGVAQEEGGAAPESFDWSCPKGGGDGQ
jgi:hypothetical protein